MPFLCAAVPGRGRLTGQARIALRAFDTPLDTVVSQSGPMALARCAVIVGSDKQNSTYAALRGRFGLSAGAPGALSRREVGG